MPAVPPVHRRLATRAAVAAAIAVGLVAGVAVAAPAAAAAPVVPAPSSPAGPPAAAKPPAVSAPRQVAAVAARVTGGRQVTVTWAPPARQQPAGADVTVCRVDAAVATALDAHSCSVSWRSTWTAGRFDDLTVRPGRTYSYAVVPVVAAGASAALTGAGVGRPVTVTVPRTVRQLAAPRVTPAATGTGSVAGTVTTAAGTPVPGATAMLIGYQYPDGYVVRGSAVTAADGTYRITGVADPGPDSDTAALCIDGGTSPARPTSGFVDACWRGAAWDGLIEDIPYQTDHVDARNAVATTGIDVTLATGATVSGRVTATGGAAVAGASVYAEGAIDGTFRTRTGADGRYVLAGIPAASVTVCVDAESATVPAGSSGYAAQCYDGQPWNRYVTPPAARGLVLTAGTVRTGTAFTLGPAAAVTGTVTAQGGALLSGVGVHVRPTGDDALDPPSGGGGLASTGGDGDFRPDAVTGADGRWTVTGLDPGQYAVCFDASSAAGGPSTTGYRGVCTGGVPFVVTYGGLPANVGTVGLTRGAVTRSDITLSPAGGLGGTVTDAAGTGLTGVSVQVFPATGLNRYQYASVTTGTGGRWTVDGITPGAVVVCFEASAAAGASAPRGWVDQCSGGVVWNGSGTPPSGAQSVTVTAGQRTTVTTALAAGGAVTGTVSAAAGPVAGAGVSVWLPGGSRLPQTAVTAADGTFVLRGLATGRYLVCVDPDATTPTPSGLTPRCYKGVTWNVEYQPPASATSLQVTVGATTRAGALTLPPAASVSGRVTAADGSPLAGVNVQVSDEGLTTRYYATTGADGRYTVTGVTVASVQVCFSTRSAVVTGGTSTTGYASQCWQGIPWDGQDDVDATSVPVAAGAAVTGIDAQLVAAGGLAGTVTPAGRTTGLPGVAVQVFDADGQQAAYVTTAVDGTYRVTGLVPGAYRVCTSATALPAPGGSTPTCAASVSWGGGYDDPLPATATVFTVTSGAVTTGASVATRSGGAVAGTVTSDAGAAVSEARVDVFDARGDVAAIALTSADGSYLAPGLPAGSYRVCFESSPFPALTPTGLLAECSANVAWTGNTGDGPPSGSAAVAVRAGARTTGVDASLSPAGALAGVLTEAGGVGVVSGDVEVFAATGGALVGSTFTSDNGSWRATGLAAGRYVVCARAYSYSAAPSGLLPRCFRNVAWDGSGSAPAGATVLTVSASATTAASYGLPIAAGIGGTVTGQDGAAIPFASVSVYRANGQLATSDTASSDGSYVVGGLLAGSYRVCVSTDVLGPRGGGYLPTCAGGVAWDPQGPPPTTATVYALSLGAVGGPADVTLPEAAALAGTVKDAVSGHGLGNAGVTVYASPGGESVGYGYTDGTGAWTVAGLHAGTYAVCVDARFAASSDAPAGYLSRCWRNVAYDGYQLPARATAITVPATGVVGNIAVTLPRGAGISGRITADGSGAPVGNVAVHVYTNRGADVGGYVVTGSDGTYSATGLPAGSFVVCFDASQSTAAGSTSGLFSECFSDVRWNPSNGLPAGVTPVTAVAGQVRQGLDAALAPSAAIQGRVVSAGDNRPLANAFVSVLTVPDGNYVGYTSTSETGTYSLGGLDAGRYVVCVDGSGVTGGTSSAGYRNQCFRNVDWPTGSFPPVGPANKVTTTAGTATTGVNFALAAGAAISGTVTDADGNVLDDVRVVAFAGGTEVSSNYTYQGSYAVSGLAPGSYQLCFDASSATGPGGSGGFASECADDVPWPGASSGDGPPAGAATFTLTAGTTTTVDASLG